MQIDNSLAAFRFRFARSPARLVMPEVRLPAPARLPLRRALTKSAAVAKKRAGGLGAVDWGGIIGNLATSAVTYKMATLNRSRQEAEARLEQAKQVAAEQEAQRVMTQQAARQPVKKALPIMPLAIGGIALAGAAFFLMKKKR